jgi:hypothetical protein
MIEVANVKYIDNYRIWLEFNDGKSGIADLSESLWGNIFEPVKNPVYFKIFKLSSIMNTIEWDNGADFAPEYLYELVN